MPRKPAPSPRSLALEGDLDLFSIHAQWEQLVPLAAEGGPLELDLKGIGDLDLSGLQLLSALERDLKEHGGRLALTGTRAEWLPRFELLGLASLFEERTP